MTEDALKQRRAYQRRYRALNKDTINKRQKEWRKANKDKVKEYNKTYWENVAKKYVEQTSN
mgnify:FL=1|jgi:hypothetical protein